MNSITSTSISLCVRIRLIKDLVPVQIPVQNLETNKGKMKAYRPAPKWAMGHVHSTHFHALFPEDAYLGVWYCLI